MTKTKTLDFAQDLNLLMSCLLLAIILNLFALQRANIDQNSLDFSSIAHRQAEIKEPQFTGNDRLDKIPVKRGVIREVTAYNAGDPNQTDSTPCDGPGGNICKLLDQGIKVCAANFVPLRTKLRIKNYGDCVVMDRMNERYQESVDIAMKRDEKARALNFGRQWLEVIEL